MGIIKKSIFDFQFPKFRNGNPRGFHSCQEFQPTPGLSLEPRWFTLFFIPDHLWLCWDGEFWCWCWWSCSWCWCCSCWWSCQECLAAGSLTTGWELCAGDRGGGGGGGGEGGEGGGEEWPWRRIEERRPPHLQSTSASPLLNWIENQDHIIRRVLVQNHS